MLIYALKRLAYAILTLLTVLVTAFIIVRFVPGAGNVLDDPNLTDDAREVLLRQLGLDRPVLAQLADYFRRIILYADFGVSRVVEPGVPVFDIIRRRMPITAIINAAALLLALPVGAFLGIMAALGRGAVSGKAVIFASVILVSVPSFVLAAVLRYWIAFRFDIFPILYMPTGGFWQRASSLVLPVFALSLAPIAAITRMLRAELVDAQNEVFMSFAYAKGLSRYETMKRHGLRYAAVPIIPVVVLMFTDVLAGSLVIERIFAIPGMGGVLVDSIIAGDHSLTMAVLIFFTAAELLLMFLADVALAAFDPRIRLAS